MNIFVSIAAFCEPYLEFTLDSLFSRSIHPENIFVGLVDQSFDNNRSWLTSKPYWRNVRYVQFNPIESRGVSWARSLAFSLYEEEQFLLQIDSHTYFESAWDQTLIEQMQLLQATVDKPILTTYPPPFEFNDNNEPHPTLKLSKMISVLRKNPENELQDDSAILMFRVEYEEGGHFIEGFHVAGGFLFTLGRFVEEVPYDPYMYFHGEEQNLALRAYTRGWTIFHPRQDAVPLYHLYKQPHQAHITHHWNAEYENQRQVKWTDLKQRAERRLLALVSKKASGIFGLGADRTVEDFVELSKISYDRYFQE